MGHSDGNQDGKSWKKKEKNRGTRDELEILALILAENTALRDRVISRLEEAMGRDKGSKLEKKGTQGEQRQKTGTG